MAKTGGITREGILDVAEGVLLKNGLRRASLGDIAKAAGISKGTLYYYYTTRDNLIFSVAIRYFEMVNARMIKWLESVQDKDMSEDVLRPVLEYVIGDERMTRIMLCLIQDALSGNVKLKERFLRWYNDWKKMLSDAIARIFHKDESQSQIFAELLVSLIEGFAVRTALAQRPPDFGGLARALSRAFAFA